MCISCVIKFILCNQLIKCMPSIILTLAIIVISLWIQAHPSLISTYLQALSPHHKARGHQTSQTQQISGTKQYNSSPMALPPLPEPPTQLGNKGLQPFVKSLMLPQPQLHKKTLLLFATHLATSNIVHTTIKVYISAIRHMHVSTELHVQFNSQLTPRLQLILKGIQRNQAISHPQELVYQLPYKLCSPSMTCSSTNPIHTPTS